MHDLDSILKIGENARVEFKRCGNGLHDDFFETVCSFSNRFGGDIFLGVHDDGVVEGVPENAAADIARNIINCGTNPKLFEPAIWLQPVILEYRSATIIRVHVESSPEVHQYKGRYYDRVGDADIRVRASSDIFQLYLRKRGVLSERTVFPLVGIGDLRADLIDRARKLAALQMERHPWTLLEDQELLASAGLYLRDIVTGEQGYTLAAILLLGTDDVIKSAVPTYLTDALVRKVDEDRYDDREIVQTNLLDSYAALLDFARRHLLNKFYLEGAQRISLSSILAREVIANTLIHREFTSPLPARLVIEQDRLYVENANRSATGGYLTNENLAPLPKNPSIAAFFRNIGYADQLGSGIRNAFRFSRIYSGRDPEFRDDEVFQATVPLDDTFSANARLNSAAERPPFGKTGGIEVQRKEASEEDTWIQTARNRVAADQTGVLLRSHADDGPHVTTQTTNKTTQSISKTLAETTQSGEEMADTTQLDLADAADTTQSGSKTTQSPGHARDLEIPVPERTDESFRSANDPAGQVNAGNYTQSATGQQDSASSTDRLKKRQDGDAVRQRILALVADNPHASQKDIAVALEMNVDLVKYHVRQLKAAGLLSRTGNARTGVWTTQQKTNH